MPNRELVVPMIESEHLETAFGNRFSMKTRLDLRISSLFVISDHDRVILDELLLSPECLTNCT